MRCRHTVRVLLYIYLDVAPLQSLLGIWRFGQTDSRCTAHADNLQLECVNAAQLASRACGELGEHCIKQHSLYW
jgi:hypothetical protein